MHEPTFLYIGAAKSGSSWIFEALDAHPDVFVPPAKDIMFFDKFYDRGMDWYLSYFAKAGASQARGELSHDYFLSSGTAQRIHERLPGVKLICCLRESVEYMISHYQYNRSKTFKYNAPGEPAGSMSFETFIRHPEVVPLVDYYNNLKPFFDLFPRDQILVLYYDDLRTDVRAFAHTLYTFLGVDPHFEPWCLTERVNEAGNARAQWLAVLSYEIGLLVRKLGFANVVGRVKRNRLFNALLYTTEGEAFEIGAEARREVYETYSKDYSKLEGLLEKPLPPSWYRE